MPRKTALVNFSKCDPKQCELGICATAQACSHKLLKQDTPYEIPMPDPSICRGCGDCARPCLLKAIMVVTM